MSINIYVLNLEGGFYYVGKTNDIAKRYQQHLDGKGSSWTKIHKPLSISEIKPCTSTMDEDKYTKEYMIKYGIDKVRGGSYVKEELDDEHIKMLQKELWGSQDLCTKCGRKGHFIKNCHYKKDVNGNVINELNELLPTNINMTVLKTAIAAAISIVTETMTETAPKKQELKVEDIESFNCKYCNKEFDTKKSKTYHENLKCKNKPEKGTEAITESASKNKNVKVEEKVETFNCKYCNKEFDTKKSKTFHENIRCKDKPKKGCDICGHDNHDSSKCYASKDVNGNKIEELWQCNYCDKEFSDEEKCEKHEKICGKSSKVPICYVCKNYGHYANQCYEK